MEEEIRSEFIKNGFTLDNEKEIIEKCLEFCIQHKLTASDLVSSWDVYSLNRGLEFTVQSSHVGSFLEQLQNEQLGGLVEKEPELHLYSNDVAMITNGMHEDTQIITDTPTRRHLASDDKPLDSTEKSSGYRFPSLKSVESLTPFGSRKNKFVVQTMLNEHRSLQTIKVEEDHDNSDEDIIRRLQPSQKCSLQIAGPKPQPGCRFMYDRVEDKFDFLENLIKDRATACALSGLYDEPVDPSFASQKSIFALGMICSEEEGRLKEKPVMLQSSVQHSGGQRVRMNLQNLSHFSVFPGQVVAVQGHNPSGHCLIASKIIDSVPFSASLDEDYPAKRRSLDPNLQLAKTSVDLPALSLIVAAGPFTTSDSLLFEPLIELLAYARRKQPQLLVLLGPFLDSDHMELKKRSMDRTFEEIFQLEILGKLRDYVECMGQSAQVVLVPSIKDANHDFVFPQPPFEFHPSDFNHQIYSVSNPGKFSANEVNVALCTVDILKHLSAEEICRNPQGGSKQRLTNLAKHLLNQRSFYPLYPPAEGVPLDFSLAKEAVQIEKIPDILILPSDLATFVKVLTTGGENDGERQHKCICANPGRLARGEGGGFFMEINYNANPELSSASIIRI